MVDPKMRLSPQDKPRFFYGYIVVVASFLIVGVILGTRFTFGVFFRPLLAEFGWTRAMTSGAFSLSTLVQALLAVIVGQLNDRFGPRIVLTLCGLALGLGYLLMSQVSTLWQFYLVYVLIIGSGMSGSWVPLMSTVARWFVKRRSMMTGIVTSGVGIGTLIMASAASWIISSYDWRTAYIVVAGVIVTVVMLAAQFLKRDPAQVGQMPYGENKGEESGPGIEVEAVSLKQAVHTSRFWLAIGMLFSIGFCVPAIMVHIVPHAIDLGISPSNAASILSLMAGVSIVGRIVLGVTADKFGIKRGFIISFTLMAISLLWLVVAREPWMLLPFVVVFGFAWGGGITLGSPLVGRLFGLKSHGLLFGVINAGFTFGSAIAPFLTGYIFDIMGSYQVAFALIVAFSILGLILTRTLKLPQKS